MNSSLRFRGNSLSKHTKDLANTHANYREYKNYFVRRESYLDHLCKVGKLPELNDDGDINIPEEFQPSEGLIALYRKKFNQKQKKHRTQIIKTNLFQDPRMKCQKLNGGINIFDHHYGYERDIRNQFDAGNHLGIPGFDNPENRLNWVLVSSSFCVKSTFIKGEDGELFIARKLVKRGSNHE